MELKPGSKRKDFEGRGIGVTKRTSPISVMLPPEMEEYVRVSLKAQGVDRSDWLRDAIRQAIARDKKAAKRAILKSVAVGKKPTKPDTPAQ
ncbi:MAG TPA: hypothetical protein V6D27_00970 [Vampirovibrionales bacterium]